MRFGLFVPQGWRLDLVGIDPADQWAVMRDVARHAEAGRWESVWVYDHFHTVPVAHRRGVPRGVDSDRRARRGHRAHPARPDVHLHGLSQPGLPRQSRRYVRHRLRRSGRDGHRRRLVRARVAGVRLRLPVRSGARCACSTRACRSCARPGPRAGRRCTASTTTSTARSCSRGRCRRAASRCGSPAAGEKVTLRIAAKYAQYTNFDGALEGFRRKSEVLAGHCRDLGRTSTSIVRSANYNVAIGATEAEVEDRLQQLRPGWTPLVGAGEGGGASSAGSAACRPAGRRSRSWRTCGSSRTPE